MKKLSIVIPCYNCSKTISRLLDSILANGLDKDEYEVIICDDKSTDNFLDIVKTYEDRINFTYCTTTRDFHCPGNTRQAALPYITGEWFCFIDNDDLFEEDVFKKVFDYIDHAEEEPYVIVTNLHEYDLEKGENTQEMIGDRADVWLHGKFYHKRYVLDAWKCHFKEDLFSHEDGYFNSMVLAHLVAINKDYVFLPIFGYKWIRRKDSLSRSYFDEKYLYIERYLDDYLFACSDPFFDLCKNAKNKDQYYFGFNQIMMALLHGYFYYQAAIWRLGPNDVLEANHDGLRALKRRIISELKINENDIINYIYSIPDRYSNIRVDTFKSGFTFVESQSFRDFIINL